MARNHSSRIDCALYPNKITMIAEKIMEKVINYSAWVEKWRNKHFEAVKDCQEIFPYSDDKEYQQKVDSERSPVEFTHNDF